MKNVKSTYTWYLCPVTYFLDENELFRYRVKVYILKPRICFVEEYVPRTHELAKAVSDKVKDGCEIVYLKRHGVVSVSDNLGMALELAELAEVIS
ncbi:MAG: class II aldolase/adducin family protein [Ignisphaera sp.]